MGENGVDRDAKRAMEPKLVTGQNKRSRLMKLAHRLFHPGERLSQRVIHAGFWAFALRITDRLFGPITWGLAGVAQCVRLLPPVRRLPGTRSRQWRAHGGWVILRSSWLIQAKPEESWAGSRGSLI